jgi:amino acid adenylation domain-containing protein
MSTPIAARPSLHRRLDEWNATAWDFPGDTCIHHLVEAAVERAPAAVALVDADAQVTYAELERRANQLAHGLRRRGVIPDQVVAIFLERSVDMVVALLGVLKAGAAYLCLDPAYPRERLEFIWRDAQPALLISHGALLPRAPFAAERALQLDVDAPTLAAEAGDRPLPAAGPHHLAYVIYTSGSTGQPKGILLEHRGLCNLIAYSNVYFELDAQGCVLQFASPSFDVSVWEIFMALVAGARLVLPRLDPRLIALELPGLLRAQRITLAMLPPSLLRVLPATELPALRTVIAVGERVSLDNVQRWAPGRRFYNCYGPAEATVTVSGHLCSEHARYPALGPPIGRPFANTQLHVLDDRLQPVPVGVDGELCVGGVGLARGYLGRPELTAEKFVPNPFDETPGARLYRSGDLARVLDDGELEFLGRRDHQVKLRGMRVELGEIESALRTHPAVLDAVAVVQEGADRAQRLVAFVIGRAGLELTSDVLRSHLLARLPGYMVPARVELLDAFPLSPNGKVDRGALARS